jgi:hypothetical protein
MSDASAWLDEWSAAFPTNKYPPLDHLLERADSLTAADFEYLGRWKDSALESDKRWQPNKASVAFVTWMEAAKELPGAQIENVHSFLTEWSGRAYRDRFPSRTVLKRFGVPRATTLLHLMSGGKYPIFDARVRLAFKRLTGQPPGKSVEWYLSSYVPFFAQVASECRAANMKKVDNALFVYGRKKSYFG